MQDRRQGGGPQMSSACSIACVIKIILPDVRQRWIRERTALI